MFLNRILDEMAHVEEPGSVPTEEDAANYTVVGTLSRDLQRLYAVKVRRSMELKRYLRAEVIKHAQNEANDVADRMEVVQSPAFQLKKFECDLVGKLFWGAVRIEFPELFDKTSIGILPGWKIGWEKMQQISLGAMLAAAILGR